MLVEVVVEEVVVEEVEEVEDPDEEKTKSRLGCAVTCRAPLPSRPRKSKWQQEGRLD